MGASMRKILGSVVYMAVRCFTMAKVWSFMGLTMSLLVLQPEVLEGKYTETCDMWSLGVIMYMLLSNKSPFYGDTEDEIVDSIFAGDVKYDRKEWENISPQAKALLKRLIQVREAQRGRYDFPSDSSCADKPDRAIHGRPSSGPPVDQVNRAPNFLRGLRRVCAAH
jgi:serine/threonine protein kinase